EYISDSEIKSGGARPVDLDEIVEESDIVTVHVPVTPQTEGMFSEAEFKRMKDAAIIVNCSRGGIVDEQELVEALDAGEIAGAGIDTYVEEPPGNTPLTAHPKTVTTPHLGATTAEAQERIASLVIEKIEAMA
ncbi:MAG: NAD(P)-dependent oxidoreductase, partial [bacterium]